MMMMMMDSTDKNQGIFGLGAMGQNRLKVVVLIAEKPVIVDLIRNLISTAPAILHQPTDSNNSDVVEVTVQTA